jgi:hypothetical protein
MFAPTDAANSSHNHKDVVPMMSSAGPTGKPRTYKYAGPVVPAGQSDHESPKELHFGESLMARWVCGKLEIVANVTINSAHEAVFDIQHAQRNRVYEIWNGVRRGTGCLPRTPDVCGEHSHLTYVPIRFPCESSLPLAQHRIKVFTQATA